MVGKKPDDSRLCRAEANIEWLMDEVDRLRSVILNMAVVAGTASQRLPNHES